MRPTLKSEAGNSMASHVSPVSVDRNTPWFSTAATRVLSFNQDTSRVPPDNTRSNDTPPLVDLNSPRSVPTIDHPWVVGCAAMA